MFDMPSQKLVQNSQLWNIPKTKTSTIFVNFMFLIDSLQLDFLVEYVVTRKTFKTVKYLLFIIMKFYVCNWCIFCCFNKFDMADEL